MKSSISIFTCAIFLTQILFYPTMAYADEEVTTVHAGDTVPFDGTLFNTEAAARLLTELEFNSQTCQAKIDRQLGLQHAEFQLKIDTLNSSLNFCNTTLDSRLAIKDDQIDFLQTELTKRKNLNPTFAFVGGIILGSFVAIGSAYAFSAISNTN